MQRYKMSVNCFIFGTPSNQNEPFNFSFTTLISYSRKFNGILILSNVKTLQISNDMKLTFNALKTLG